MSGKFTTLELKYEETPEDVAQEYIAAMKYHVDERFLNQDFLSIIYQEVLDYMRDKGVN